MKIFNIIITTQKKQHAREIQKLTKIRSESCVKCHELDRKCDWAAVRPVIHSLKELRNNTWDKERVDQAKKWLNDNFGVPNE